MYCVYYSWFLFLVFFFFKQKTAYDVRISDWSSDVCSSDLLYVKFEGLNPTGSFKDRGMTVAVTQAVHEGAKAIICASTGNTSAAAAAYAVRAGITAFVLIPDGKIALGKLAQAVVHGAVVIQIQDRKSTRLNSSHSCAPRMPSSA